MISNKHQNKVPSSSTNMKKDKPIVQDNDKLLVAQEGTKTRPNAVTPEKHSTHQHRRGRTYACSSVDEVAKAFKLDVQDGKLVEKSQK